MNQLRRIIGDIWGKDQEYELVAGSNTEDSKLEPVLAIGRIIRKTDSGIPCEVQWFHLKRETVRKFIEDYDKGLRGRGD
jgi:hypothetical protein